MKRILVPTDFSEVSQHALNFAVDLARFNGAEVHVIHFVEIATEDITLVTADTQVVGTTEESLYNVQLMRSNKRKLEEISATLTEDNLTVEAHMSGGGFSKGLPHYVKKYGVDMVVIGTSGEENLQEFFSGNHTEQLIEHVNVPIVSLQFPTKFSDIKRIVLAVDSINEQYSPSVITKMSEVLSGFNAEVVMVDVIDAKDSVVAEADRRLKEIGEEFGLVDDQVHILRSKEVVQGLHEFTNDVNAQMVAVLSAARGGLFRFIQHSLATSLTKDADYPILTLNKRFYE